MTLMRTHRNAIASNIKDKVAEIGFFLGHILRVSESIRIKHLSKDYPLNSELAELNYFFSAYLNSIQALKDSCQSATETTISWEELSPTYGKFVYYCRNATTHDGSLMINAGQGLHNYIIGPLHRIDGKGLLKEVAPPPENVITLIQNISSEVLQTTKRVLERAEVSISSPNQKDHANAIDAVMSNAFIPDFAKKLMSENRGEILRSLASAKFDYAKDALNAIEKLRKKFGLAIT